MLLLKKAKWFIAPALMGLGLLLYQLPLFKARACLREFEAPHVYRSTLTEQKSTATLKGALTITEFQGDLVLKRSSSTDLEGYFKPLAYKSGDVTSREFKNAAHRFQIRMDEECRVTALEFDVQENFGIRDHVMKLMTFLNMGRVAELSKHEAFESSDFLGESLFEKRGKGQGGLELERTRILKHPNPKAGDTALTQVEKIMSSSLHFSISNSSIWPERSSIDERFLVLSGPDQNLFKIRYVLHMQLIPGQADFPLENSPKETTKVAKTIGEKSRAYDRPSMYTDPPGPSDVKDLDTALKNFLDLLDQDAVNAKRALIAFLKSHPDEFERLQDRIAAEAFSDHALVHILFSIAKAGSPEAQKVMADLIGNDSLSLSTRLRVIFAVAEVPFADKVLVTAIREESKRLKDPRASLDDLSSTSLLTSGILARNAIDTAPQMEAELKSDILDILQNHPNSAVKATVLDALGNYGNAELAPLVAEYVAAPSDVERTAAVRALVYLPHENRENLLIERLKIEDKANVRSAIARTLAMTGITHSSSVQAISSHLFADQEPSQRVLATKVLGQASERIPEARKALLEHIASEADPMVLESAGRYLSAYELYAMRKREH
jgi:HEAT repeat protein